MKAPFEAFIQELAPAMLSIDPQMELRPYRCMARLRRDVRFTKDKSPFRDHLWVLFRHAGEPREGVRISFDLDGGMDNGWFLLRLSVHDPVLPLNVESDVPGGVQQMLESLLKVLNDAEGIDLTPLKKAVEEA